MHSPPGPTDTKRQQAVVRTDRDMTDMIVGSCNAAAEDLGLKPDDNGLPFQIFPDPCEGQCKPGIHLPSIVVEPTAVSEVESGELRWPPEDIVAEQKAEGPQTPPEERGQSEAAS
ncbi:protein LBH-like [Narcine bancroftii]|uniref:protein LBH-like n=1 Tax=Narcine bancroftii TaxID=1343680 RepID=UPI0038314778